MGTIAADGFKMAVEGQGVADARVQLENTPYATVTDAQGRFELKDVPADKLQQPLVAKNSDANGRQFNLRHKLTKPSGSQLNLASLLLRQAGSVFGTVKAAGSSDLLGTDVFIEGTAWVAKTDKDGHFALANVPEGTFAVTAQRSGYKSVTQTVAVESGKPVSVSLEFAEKLDESAVFGFVEGKVISSQGPVAGALVSIPGEAYVSVSDKEGQYRLRVLPQEKYLLLIMREGYEPQEHTVSVAVGRTTRQDASLTAKASEAPGTIKGILKDNQGQPVANADVETEPPTRPAKTDARGGFEIPNALPGSYYVKGLKDGQLIGNQVIGLDPTQTITVPIQGLNLTASAGRDVNVCNNTNQNNVNINAPGSQVNVNIDSKSECNIR